MYYKYRFTIVLSLMLLSIRISCMHRTGTVEVIEHHVRNAGRDISRFGFFKRQRLPKVPVSCCLYSGCLYYLGCYHVVMHTLTFILPLNPLCPPLLTRHWIRYHPLYYGTATRWPIMYSSLWATLNVGLFWTLLAKEFTIAALASCCKSSYICSPRTPDICSPRTPDICTLAPQIFIPSHPRYLHPLFYYFLGICPGYPDIHTLVPRIFTPSYPGYSHPRTPDIHTLVPGYSHPRTPEIPRTRIFPPSYPGYSHRIFTLSYPDIHPLVPRIFISSYPGYLHRICTELLRPILVISIQTSTLM